MSKKMLVVILLAMCVGAVFGHVGYREFVKQRAAYEHKVGCLYLESKAELVGAKALKELCW